MKAKQETINKLRDLILVSEGKTLEDEEQWLSECCDGGGGCQCGGRPFFPTSCQACNGMGREFGSPPITLRVLRAIKKYSWEFVDAYPLPIIRLKAPPDIKISWTLCLPAHEQEEETLQALIDILTPTKK